MVSVINEDPENFLSLVGWCPLSHPARYKLFSGHTEHLLPVISISLNVADSVTNFEEINLQVVQFIKSVTFLIPAPYTALFTDMVRKVLV